MRQIIQPIKAQRTVQYVCGKQDWYIDKIIDTDTYKMIHDFV